jgi:hypothetical protein
VVAAHGLQIAAEAGVALGAQRLEDGLALRGVAPGFSEVAADDVAPAGELDFLGFQFGGRAAAARHGDRQQRHRIAEHPVADLAAGALAHPQKVFELPALQRGDGRGADHAAIGNGRLFGPGHCGRACWPWPRTLTDAALEAMLFARVGIAPATRRNAEPERPAIYPFIANCGAALSH